MLPLLVRGQQKEEILNAIIKINRLETADKGPGSFVLINGTIRLAEDQNTAIPDEYNNYKNFQNLIKLITHDELVGLTIHENGVVRMFAVRQLIKERNYQFNYLKFFLNELKRDDTISSQFADMIDNEVTYDVLLEDLSGDCNYARSTGASEDFKFFTDITRSIDSFILYTNFDFHDRWYEDIFDRHKFEKPANARILELITTKFNFWAFNYLKEQEPKLYDSIKSQTVIAFEKHKKTLLTEHPNFFEWFLRYLIESQQYQIAKSFLQELKDQNYSKKTIDWILMGIDQKLIDNVKQ